MPSVLQYQDFRLFLRELHDSFGRTKSRYSWRAISKRAKINNPNFLRQVALGERNFSEKSAEQVGRALGFSGLELEYWHRLVHFGQAKEESQKARYRLELAEMRGSVQAAEISSGFSEYYGHWFIPCIRELVTLFDFHDDYRLLARSVLPPISEDDARYAVQILQRFQFIHRNADGRWEETDKVLRSGSPGQNSPLLQYHASMLGKASQALRTMRKEDRFVMGMTIGVSKECYRMILTEAEKFKHHITALVLNDRNSDKVMQVALQIFPTGVSPGKENLKGDSGMKE